MGTVLGSKSAQVQAIVPEASNPPIEDIITEDEILCKILSSLTLREAVRTSVLSTRWRHLWPGISKFEFDVITVLDAQIPPGVCLDSRETFNETRGKTPKFIRSVNSVIQEVRGWRVDQFVVAYFFDKSYSQHVDAWVRFAVASKAKKLGLHLFRHYFNAPIEPYEFPCQLLGSSMFIETFTLLGCSLRLPCQFDGLRHLKEIGLGNVDISEEDFNRIVSNSSSTLTKLCVWYSPCWKSISIPYTLMQLQYLRVDNCHLISKIEINAVNLLKLRYMGAPVDFNFKQTSKLKSANICFVTDTSVVRTLDYYLTKLSSSLPCLQSLALKLVGDSKVADVPKGSSRFIHLTHMECEWNVGGKMSLHHLETLLDAAPSLEELKLCLQLSERAEDQPPQTTSKMREMLPKHPRNFLKIVDVSGFYFDTWQIEIVVYLLKNANALESMTITKGNRPSWMRSKKRCKTGMKILSQDPDYAKLRGL